MNIKALTIYVRMTGAMTILFVMALSWLYGMAQRSLPGQLDDLAVENKKDSLENFPGDITVSLITCYPGEEIYELCGHSAVRVRGEGIDSVWNYGIFDFNQPNFVYRFVKGETDYRGASYPFYWFMPEYVKTGRKVVEQDINFTPQEAQKMLALLRESVLPENAVYRYNYIKDNCSTRILNHVDSASGTAIIYPDSIRYGTFRNEMRAYHEGYPWYQFGIDLALGAGLDEEIDSRGEMFVPVELMRNAASAHFSDGRQFVKATRVLNKGNEKAVLPPTPWWLGPLFWAWILTFLICSVVVYQIKTGKILLAVYGVWFTILTITGFIVAFLVFISVHEATNPNILILWLNPWQLLYVLAIGIRKLKWIGMVMAYYNVVICIMLLIVTPFTFQSLNPAFYPLIISTLALAGSYAIINNKSSYKRR